jgi:hypothetical protein
MKFPRSSIKSTPFFVPWRDQVHDCYFQQSHIEYAPETRTVSITVWRPEGGVWRQPFFKTKKNQERLWEGLTIVATGIESFEMRVTECVPFFELSTVYLLPEESKIVFECHYAADIVGHGSAISAELLSTITGPKQWDEVFR